MLFYAGSYAAVLRWIRGRVPADLAEELTQQTFMQYWQWLLAAAAFPKSDKSLLLSIARSVCADHYRSIAARAVCVAIPEDFDLPDRGGSHHHGRVGAGAGYAGARGSDFARYAAPGLWQ